MRKLLITFLCCFSLSLIQAQSTLIKAKAYLNVQNGQLISPANILIEDGLIKSINPNTIPEDAQQIDLSNKIILPGLMDMHVHLDLDFNGNFDHIITKESASNGAIRAVKNAEKTLMAGFTTVRSMGQGHVTLDLIDVAIEEASDNRWISAPRIIPAGHMISITGGHADLTLGLAEGLVETGPRFGIINNPNEAIEAVRYQIKNGAKVIKIHATAGVISLEATVGAQQLSFEEMKAIVDEANRHHIKVAAHAHGVEGMIAAINAGVHSIEHGSLINDEAMKLMKEKGVFLVPTTGLVDNVLNMIENMNPTMASKANYVLPLAMENLSNAIKSGVKIALGTDTPVIPHGENAIEFSALVDRGMTSLASIQAATINSAELLGVTDRGEIKEGLLADIIAVDDNPIENIKTLEQVKFVMKGGMIYKNEN